MYMHPLYPVNAFQTKCKTISGTCHEQRRNIGPSIVVPGMLPSKGNEESERRLLESGEKRTKKSNNIIPNDMHKIENTNQKNRRQLLTGALLTTCSPFLSPSSAIAMQKEYPADLEADTNINIETIRRQKIASVKANRQKYQSELTQNPLDFGLVDTGSTFVWAGALWLLSGSRCNPLVNPLANLFYNEDEEEWLRDRNEGLFSSPPPGLYLILATIFVILGVGMDRILFFLTEGDRPIGLELGVSSLIAGFWVELGRIAGGEKGKDREESERDEMLEAEFMEFAQSRLVPGGNCHRSEVAGAFRRYNAKYRYADSDEYPLADIEIERMVKRWGKEKGIKMSSAGFFNGVQINTSADIFVERR